MSFDLKSIVHGKSHLPPRVILGGVEGVGKSKLASSAPSPIFIPMAGERGLDQIDTAKFPPAASHADLMEALRVLYSDTHDFKTVVIDSASALEPLIFDAACKEANVESIEKIGGGYGKGYLEALRYWREITTALDYLRDDKGMGSIIIAHVKVKTWSDPSTDNYDTFMLDMNDKASNQLLRWCDAALFLNFQRAIIKTTEGKFNQKSSRGISTGERLIYTEKRAAHFGKNRFDMPYELPLPKENGWAILAPFFSGNGKEATDTKPEATEKKPKK